MPINPPTLPTWFHKNQLRSPYIYGGLAIICLFFATIIVFKGTPNNTHTLPNKLPPHSPFTSAVAGAGLIEAASENIAIGTPLSGTIAHVYVKAGETVEAGAPLFSLDSRIYLAQKAQLQAAVDLAKAQLALLEAHPRPETVPPAEARVKETEFLLEQAKLLWQNVAPLEGTGAIGEEALLIRKLGYRLAQAQLSETKHNLDLLKAGTWVKDIDVAKANLELAEANLKVVEVELERIVVKAPIKGTVLRINIHEGEFAQNNGAKEPLIIFGSTNPLHVRVDIDDKDVPRFIKEATAYATPRGDSQKQYPLQFVRIEPYVLPKQNLTGVTTQLVDTRVFQIIYALPEAAQGLYVGQQMDAFIEAK